MGRNRSDVFNNAETPITGSAAGALLAANNLSDVAALATAQSNLGMGFLATTTNSITTNQIADLSVTSVKLAGSITLSKLQTISDQRILGNVSGISVPPAQLTAAQVRTMIDTNTTPSTANIADTAAVGTADTLARGDHKHALPSPHSSVYTTVNATSTNSAALANLGMQHSLTTNATYYVQFCGQVISSLATVGHQITFNLSQTVQAIQIQRECPTSATTWAYEVFTANQGGTIPGTGSIVRNQYKMEGIVVTSNTACTMDWQHRSRTTNSVTVFSGAFGTAMRMA